MFATWAELFKKDCIDEYKADMSGDRKDNEGIILDRVKAVMDDFRKEKIDDVLVSEVRAILKRECERPLWLKITLFITEVVGVIPALYILTNWDKLPKDLTVPLLAYVILLFLSIIVGRVAK